MLTLEELERRAYISGDTKMAAALAEAMDLESEALDEARHDADQVKQDRDNALNALESIRDILDNVI